MNTPARALSLTAFLILLMVSFMMGSNHVAARLAFNSGVDVATAVASRSLVTALIVSLIVLYHRLPRQMTSKQWRGLLLVGVMIGIQSQCLYSAVARLPVALALLAFNTFPLWTALWEKLIYKRNPEKTLLYAMPVILLGLALALDVLGASSGLGSHGQWQRIGTGVAFALGAALTFGLALVWTQYETAGLDGRIRTAGTMMMTGVIALAIIGVQGGPHWPQSGTGWAALIALTLIYGTAFTVMFTVLPKLGVVGNSAIMNAEPVFALILAWIILHQTIAPIQVIGALLVVGAVIGLGLRKR